MSDKVQDSRKPSHPMAHRASLLVLRCVALLLVNFLFACCTYAQGSQQATPKPSAAAPTAASEYVGEDTCKTCHEDLAKHFEHTAHFATTLDKKAGPEHQGCEACHGPGKAHVEGGGDVTKIINFKI